MHARPVEGRHVTQPQVSSTSAVQTYVLSRASPFHVGHTNCSHTLGRQCMLSWTWSTIVYAMSSNLREPEFGRDRCFMDSESVYEESVLRQIVSRMKTYICTIQRDDTRRVAPPQVISPAVPRILIPR